MNEKELRAVIKLRDEISKPLKEINGVLKDVDSQTKQSKKSFFDYGDTLKKVGKQATLAGGAIVASIGGALGMVAKQAIEFESAFTGVVKTLDVSGLSDSEVTETLNGISDGLKEMSTRIPQTAAELAGIAEIAGQLGIESSNILAFTETMAMLADTTNIAGEEGALALAKFMNVMGTSQGDIDRLGSTIVNLGEDCCPVTWKQVA